MPSFRLPVLFLTAALGRTPGSPRPPFFIVSLSIGRASSSASPCRVARRVCFASAEAARSAVDLRCACAVTAEGLGGATPDLQRDCGSGACHLVLCICVGMFPMVFAPCLQWLIYCSLSLFSQAAVGGHNAPMRQRRLGPVAGVPAWKPYLGQPDAAAVRRNGAGGATVTPNSLFVSPAAAAHRCGTAPAVGASAAAPTQAGLGGGRWCEAHAPPGTSVQRRRRLPAVGAAAHRLGLGPDGWRSHGARATCPVLPRPSPGRQPTPTFSFSPTPWLDLVLP
jgi:hypothetical protein